MGLFANLPGGRGQLFSTNLTRSKLIVGLGNVGDEYVETRHNVGFLTLDRFSESRSFSDFKEKKKLYSLTSEGEIEYSKIILAKPNTLMNLSGRAVIAISQFYKINNEDILVIHDDADLRFGETKLKRGGGDAGHNGLKSITNAIGEDYWRLRIGIGRADNPNIDLSDYVLSKFKNEELKALDRLYPNLFNYIDNFIKS